MVAEVGTATAKEGGVDQRSSNKLLKWIKAGKTPTTSTQIDNAPTGMTGR
jgi:hypothetical protein